MVTQRSHWRRKADSGLVLLFFLMIGMPLARNLAGPTPVVLGSEQRKPSPLPELRLKSGVLRAFPARFDAFFNDQFGYRDGLIRWLSRAKVAWLRVSTSTKVTLGDDGWLFSSELPYGLDGRPARPFSLEELGRWQQLLENRADWLAERGIKYLFVIAPNKQTIYPEYLPEPMRRLQSGRSRLDQLVSHLQNHSFVRVVDLRAPLLRAKNAERIYDRTDSHWNDRGAYAGYQGIMEALKPAFLTVRTHPREWFEALSVRGPGGDLARMLDADHWMREDRLCLGRRTAPTARLAAEATVDGLGPRPFAMECPDPSLPRTVILCDSFMVHMTPFLSEHFSRVFYGWQMMFPTFETDLIERERPDVVIQEIIERKLVLPVPKVISADRLAGRYETWATALP